MCPTALVVVVLIYTLFILASVPYGYLLGFGNTLIANPYVRILTDGVQRGPDRFASENGHEVF